MPVPLAGLEPATCCLGDNCPSSAQTGPVGSRQVRLGRHSVQCGLVGCSRAWWNDRENDHLSKQRGRGSRPHAITTGVWSTGPRAGLELRQLGQDALGSSPIAVLAAAFGVEVESAARTASEGVAQLVTGPEGNSALGLVQERG